MLYKISISDPKMVRNPAAMPKNQIMNRKDDKNYIRKIGTHNTNVFHLREQREN
jgi:hypothetical protein